MYGLMYDHEVPAFVEREAYQLPVWNTRFPLFPVYGSFTIEVWEEGAPAPRSTFLNNSKSLEASG